MLFNLGIGVTDGVVVAAAERSGSVRGVTLGRATREVRASAYVETDGAVRVGDEAIGRSAVDPTGFVDDVTELLGDQSDRQINGWSVTGDVLMAHLFAAVVRQAAQDGDELGRSTIAYPPQWPASKVEALRTAAISAGIADVELVSSERAVQRAPAEVRTDSLRSTAMGAAALAAARPSVVANTPTQMLAPVAADAIAAPDPITGAIDATTVFGADEPAAQAMAGGDGSGVGGPPMMPPPGGGEFEPPERSRVPFYVAGGVLAGMLIALVLVLLLRDGNGTSTDASTTLPPETTTSTSTTSTSTTTSTTTTTTTTTPPSTTTTTIPREVGNAGLLDSGLVLGYGTSSSRAVFFGDAAGDVMGVLQAALGNPTRDTGWVRESQCFGDLSRRVRWGDLEVVFTETREAGSPDPVRTFDQWFVGQPGTVPVGLVTLDRIGIGSTVADLRRAYPRLDISRPVQGNNAGFFTTMPQGEDLIAGVTSDVTDSARVVQMWAGSACQRIAE